MSDETQVGIVILLVVLFGVFGFWSSGGSGEEGSITEEGFVGWDSVCVEDFSDSLLFIVTTDYGFRRGNSMRVEEGKILVELRIFDSGEGYIIGGLSFGI